MPEFKIIEVEQTPYFYAERSTSRDQDEVGPAMGAAFQEVWAFMQAAGIAPTGGALSVTYSYDPDRVDFRAGFTVARDDMARASGPVKADVTPAGRVVHGTHKGPYSGIRQSYGAMHAVAQKAGVPFTAPTWKVYLNGPDEVPEEDLLTDLYQALAD